MGQVSHRYTPQEAAALSGERLQRIQNAITERILGTGFPVGSDRRRVIDLPAVLTFATMHLLSGARIEPAALYKAFSGGGLPHEPIRVNDAIILDAPRLLGEVLRKIKLYDHAKTCIVSDPKILGGVPIVCGTRLSARMIHARITSGESQTSLLHEYPYLKPEDVEAAVLYTAANPVRGCPQRTVRAK